MLSAALIGITFWAESDPSWLYLNEHKQLYDDWTTQPFVDITLESNEVGCPLNYEPLLFRYWPGTYDVCIENEMYGGTISRFDSDKGCKTGVKVDAIPPVNMTSLSGMTACGRRGGPNFVETVRVDPYTLECPQGLEPCSD